MTSEKFENKISRIEEIIKKLESGNLDLDISIKNYNEAIELIKDCYKMLENAEGEIKKIVEKDGETKLEDFKEED